MNGNTLFWRSWYRLRFYLFQRRRFNQLGLENVAGRSFVILPAVFNPALFFTSEFMVQAFNEQVIPTGCALLDMGTGSGIGAVFAAQWAGHVVGVDVNPAAVRCARMNVLLNEVEDRVTVRQGDLFAPVRDERFDVILFNPPYYRGEPTSLLDHAFHATDVMERFVRELAGYLNPGGYALLILSTAGDEATFLAKCATAGYQISALQQQTYPLERLTLYQLTPQTNAVLAGP